MKGTCNIHGGNKCNKILAKKPQGKTPTERLRHRQKKTKWILEKQCVTYSLNSTGSG